MKRKILWLGVSWLIVAALVLASCGPTVPEEEEEEEEGEEIVTLSIGETYQTPEVAVTVSEVIITDSYEYFDLTLDSMATKEASPGTYFLISTVAIKNVGSVRRLKEGAIRFLVYDSAGSRYENEAYEREDRLLYDPRLRVGKEIKGAVLFSISEGASGLKIIYREEAYPYKKVAEWVIE